MLIKGIFTDVEVNNQPPEFARHLKNVLLTEKLGTPINEPGFVVCVAGSELPYEVNGVYVIDEAIVLWSTDNTNSEVGVVESCLYRTIVNDTTFSGQKLNFSTNFPIDAQHYLNFNSERVVAWIDDINEPRILNIDNLNVQELNDIRIFPFADTPDLTFTVKDSGGSLESGTHQIVVSYANRNGLETNWFAIGKPMSITDSPLSGSFIDYDGIEAGVLTSKAIEIAVENADTRFELMRIGVVKTIDSIVTAQFVKEVPIGQATFDTIYTGSEGTIVDITLDEILVPSASYKTAKAIGQVNNKLYLGNLTVDEEIDLTEVALNTTLKWAADYPHADPTSLGNPGGSNKNPNNEVGFWPGEVYAFYLVGEKLDGTLTKAFHIPGRESIPSDFDLNTAAATGQLTDDPKNYEVDSTVQNVQFITGLTQAGEFGYWENKNEVYPSATAVVQERTIPASIVALPSSSEVIYRLTESTSSNVSGTTNTLIQSITAGVQAIRLIVLDGGTPTAIEDFPFTIEAFDVVAGTIDLNFAQELPHKSWNFFAYSEIGFSFGGTSDWTGEAVNLADKIITTNQLVAPIPVGYDGQIPNSGDQITLAGFDTGDGVYTVQNAVIHPVTDADYVIILVGGVSGITGAGTITYNTLISVNIWPTGNVRHHRFPTLHKLRQVSVNPFVFGNQILPRLSVLAEDVVIPIELQDKITKWFVTWAKRTPANATVMGQAPYQYAGLDEEDYTSSPANTGLGKKFSPSIGNLVIGNTNQPNTGNGEQSGRNDSQRYLHQEVLKFSSFELINNKPSMGSLYLRQEFRMQAGDAYADQTSIGGSGDLDSGVYANPIADHNVRLSRWIFLNHQKQFSSGTTVDADLLREVDNYTYLPANVIDLSALGLGADLRNSEESLFLRVKGGQPASSLFTISPDPNGIPALNLDITYRMTGNNSGASVSDAEETFISTLCQRKDNVYTPFTEQQQVLCTGKGLVTETTARFYGGDARVSFTGMKHLAPYAAHNKFRDFYTGTNNPGVGAMGIRYFGAYSTQNIGLRYLDNSKISSFYFPKVPDFYNGIYDITLPGDYSSLLYNDDYTLVNEYNAISIHNPASIPASTVLPHTIASSVTNELEERTISWQTFLSADRYVMPRNKGPIINLQGVSNDRLFIHQRDSLFITRSTTTLVGDITNVTLGSGDLFSVTPTEVLSTDEGFGGTQHKFACKLTKAGYAFPDAAQGKIFLHNGSQLDEISKNGERIFFRDNIDKNLLDNPFQGTGITITFDEKFNRLLVGVRDGDTSFTASYSPATQAWASFHDYFPEFLIETRRKLYSLKNDIPSPGYKGIYEHHIGAFGIYYNVVDINPVPFPMLVDIVANPAPFDNKIFGAVEWASEVIQANGVQAKDETIDYITISNNTKTTGRVELERLVNLSQIHDSNTRNVNEFWNFNGLRDVAVLGVPFRLDFYDDFAIIDSNLDYNKPWYKKAKFIDRFIVTRFEYSNLGNNRFSLLNHEVLYRESYR